ncbi:MAG TPA: carbohydrate ABC transporter permease [Herpetosiphon sp.]|uniref:Binding-protein-dependent transport systems inner membrane component n=1 Tax=Herpetosiphon aurantiacus (strain ATCC 23779 / DSM 785 / 114-95) TaxID=316274 RepID=A9B1K8_HERA2|nr:carbohydrate ABC transporter permease [Herpetosiphon sp.]ABX03893.1 binding-protein-dependent transport systems inner membrane component [Herpetosiphon aurantiacus DSM 785]MCA0351042.1 carbohydrate ABC transporter permease [Chloroflexota bacterium]HBW50290.1 carbohydrate ABC transporter permease [Herpetosiphon sp.]
MTSLPIKSTLKKPHQAGFGRYLVLAALIIAVLVVLLPFAIVVINAFKTPTDYASNGPLSWPSAWSIDGIVEFWQRVDYSQKLLNSLLISASVAVIGVLLSLLNAFALGIGRIKGRVWLLILFMVANTLPQESLVYPLYYLSKEFDLYNTRFVVILIFSVIQSAFGTYLLSSVFSTFPKEMLEAAMLDGCNKLQLLFKIIVPVSRPTLSVLFTFFFIWTWNEFFLPLILLISNDRQTVPIAVGVLQGQRNMEATLSSASALLGILPCFIFFLIFQRTLTKGIAAGSVK